MTQTNPMNSIQTDEQFAEIIDLVAANLGKGDSAIEAILRANPDYTERVRDLLPTLRAVSLVSAVKHPSAESNCSVPAQIPELGQDFAAFELGDYRILREIGRGGMGVVFEAEQVSLRRRVALKVLPLAGILDSRVMQRFRNEAQAAASLNHPHIVPIYGVGCERGVHFYAMQFVEGMSLDHVIRLRAANADASRHGQCLSAADPAALNQFNLPVPDALEWDASESGQTALAILACKGPNHSEAFYRRVAELGIQAADALEHAHQLGVLHRDIKPGNLLLDETGNLWITDFGLARIEGEHNLTMTGDFLGTLRYMSPEQAVGNRLDVDHRTDIYSLGATLYELIACRPAIAGDRREQILSRIVSEDPTTLRYCSVGVPADLETIILKCLSKEPRDRYLSAGELVNDLRRFLAHEPTQARPLTMLQKAARWVRRNQILVRSSIAAFMVCVVSMAIAAVVVVNDRKNTKIARLVMQADSKAAAVAQQVLRTNDYISRIHLSLRAIRSGNVEESNAHLNSCVPKDSEPDLRGFEWHYIRRLAQVQIDQVARHEEKVWGVVVSPDGHFCCSCGLDGARIWELATWQELFRVTQHDLGVNSANFSPDSRFVATTGQDGQVRIWSVSQRTLVANLRHDAPVIWAGYSNHGDELIAVAQEGGQRDNDARPINKLYVWETASWSLRATHEFQQGWIESGDITDDGLLCASGNTVGEVCIWETATGVLQRKFQPISEASPPNRGVRSIDFAHRHPWFATVNPSGIIRIWDHSKSELQSEIHLPNYMTGMIEKVVFSPDDRLVAACYSDLCFVYILADDGSTELLCQFHTSASSRSLAFADDQTLLMAGNRGTIYRYRFPTTDLPKRYVFEESDNVPVVRFGSDGQLLMAANDSLSLYDLHSTGEPMRVVTPGFDVRSTEWSPDGKTIVIGGTETGASGDRVGRISILDSATFSSMTPSIVALPPIDRLQFVCRDRVLIVSNEPRVDQWFEYPSWEKLARPVDQGSFVGLPHLDWFLGTDQPDHLSCFDSKGVRWRHAFPGGANGSAVTISPSGNRIAMGRVDGTIAFIDPSNGQIESSFAATDSQLDRLIYSPDGGTLAGWDVQKHLILWNVLTGRQLLELPLTSFQSVISIVFSPKQRAFAIAGMNLSKRPQVLIYGPFAD